MGDDGSDDDLFVKSTPLAAAAASAVVITPSTPLTSTQAAAGVGGTPNGNGWEVGGKRQRSKVQRLRSSELQAPPRSPRESGHSSAQSPAGAAGGGVATSSGQHSAQNSPRPLGSGNNSPRPVVPGATISSGHNSPRPPLVAAPKSGGSPAPRLGDGEKAAGAGTGGGGGGAGVLVGKHLGSSPSPRSPAVHGGVGLAIEDLPSRLDLKHATSPRSQASPRDAGSPASVASPRKEKVPSKWDNATARYLARSKGSDAPVPSPSPGTSAPTTPRAGGAVGAGGEKRTESGEKRTRGGGVDYRLLASGRSPHADGIGHGGADAGCEPGNAAGQQQQQQQQQQHDAATPTSLNRKGGLGGAGAGKAPASAEGSGVKGTPSGGAGRTPNSVPPSHKKAQQQGKRGAEAEGARQGTQGHSGKAQQDGVQRKSTPGGKGGAGDGGGGGKRARVMDGAEATKEVERLNLSSKRPEVTPDQIPGLMAKLSSSALHEVVTACKYLFALCSSGHKQAVVSHPDILGQLAPCLASDHAQTRFFACAALGEMCFMSPENSAAVAGHAGVRSGVVTVLRKGHGVEGEASKVVRNSSANSEAAASAWVSEDGLVDMMKRCMGASHHVTSCVTGAINAMSRAPAAARALAKLDGVEGALLDVVSQRFDPDWSAEDKDRHRGTCAAAAMALVNIKFAAGKGCVPVLEKRAVGWVHMVCSAAVDGVPFAGTIYSLPAALYPLPALADSAGNVSHMLDKGMIELLLSVVRDDAQKSSEAVSFAIRALLRMARASGECAQRMNLFKAPEALEKHCGSGRAGDAANLAKLLAAPEAQVGAGHDGGEEEDSEDEEDEDEDEEDEEEDEEEEGNGEMEEGD